MKKVKCSKLEIISIILVLVVVIMDIFCVKSAHYVAGLKGNPFWAMWIIPLVIILFVLLFLVLTIAIINLIRTFTKSYKKEKMEWTRLSFSLLPFMLCLLLYFGSIGEAGAVDFLRGYEKWVHNEVDIAAIQEWLISLDPVYSEKHYFEAEDFPEDLPAAVLKLDPYHMSFSKFDKDERSVEFEWGCGLGHWGIRIGLSNMKTPKEECIKIYESEWEYRRPIQSGVYIFSKG